MAVTGVWCLPLWRWLEKKVVTHLSKMLINGEIDENTTVYIDAKPDGQELIFKVVHDGSLINSSYWCQI